MTLEHRYQQFFTLLRSGLWGTDADASLFDSTTDWMSLFQIAKSQSTLALVYDGILTLPRELRPERRLFLQWSNIVAQIEEENDHLNDRLHEVFDLFQQNGLTPILLKGQGVAQCYRRPEHRQCGDIDVFIGKRDYEKANALLRVEATGEHNENMKHTGFVWRGIEVEVHRQMAHLSTPWRNAFFQRTLRGWFPKGSRAVLIKERPVAVNPLEFDVLYVFIHSLCHCLNEGIGLRQICDWANMLASHRKHLNHNELLRLLEGTGLLKAARIFGAVATDVLGLPADCLPFTLQERDHRKAEWLLADILEGGNFGHHDAKRERRPEGHWAGKWFTLRRAFGRCRKMGSLAPSEACWYPLSLTFLSIQMQWHLLLRR